jgi:DNA-binding transcriptional MocR family regulator
MNLSRGARDFYRFLATFKPGRAFMYKKTMAEELNCSEQTVRRWITELRNGGYIATRKRQHASAVYTILRPLPQRTEVCL